MNANKKSLICCKRVKNHMHLCKSRSPLYHLYVNLRAPQSDPEGVPNARGAILRPALSRVGGFQLEFIYLI